jgi:hypothetical protein
MTPHFGYLGDAFFLMYDVNASVLLLLYILHFAKD